MLVIFLCLIGYYLYRALSILYKIVRRKGLRRTRITRSYYFRSYFR